MLSKKDVMVYKNTLKSVITVISKYGVTGHNSNHKAMLYHYIKGDEIHPIVFVDQTVNPFGAELPPVKFIVTGANFPKSIDPFSMSHDENKDWTLGKIYVVNYSTMKEIVDGIKPTETPIEIIDNTEVSIWTGVPIKEQGLDHTAARLYHNVKSVIDASKLHEFNVIDDEQSVNGIISALLMDGSYTVENKEANMKIKLFSSILPSKFDKLEYLRYLNIMDQDVVSTIYLRYYVKDVVVSTFYKYIDILHWDELIGAKNESN